MITKRYVIQIRETRTGEWLSLAREITQLDDAKRIVRKYRRERGGGKKNTRVVYREEEVLNI